MNRHLLQWRRSPLLWGCGVLIAVAIMAGVVTIFHEPVMIVPEVGAVSAGLLFFRINAWREGPLPFYLVICGAAFLGVEIARYLSLTLVEQIILALAIILAAVLFFRVPAYPALSAGLLPVYLHLISPFYVVAVVIFMGIPTGFILITERPGIGPGPKIPISPRTVGIIVGALALMVIAAWLTRSPIAVLPPLFVATVENANAPTARSARQLSLTALALLGAIELTIVLYVNLNAVFVILITVALALIVIAKFELESPPILALAIIPTVFTHGTDLRISYLILIGIALSQVGPPAVAWIVDRIAALPTRSIVPDFDQVGDDQISIDHAGIDHAGIHHAGRARTIDMNPGD